ncbi:hypothetical protein F4802DRAFT_10575 [Xylaria palmicola]|nr:hypothetical protein F4802DRAFT_10575 [Xylaria palmicola]
MHPQLTCSLCGAGNRDHHGLGANSHWSAYYRAVYCVGPDGDEPRLSGLACYREHDEKIHLPPEAHQRFDDVHLDPRRMVTIQGVAPPSPDLPEHAQKAYAWGFRFHESCWKLLEQASVPKPVDVKMLWRILCSLPHSSHLPFWGHNFGGLYLRHTGRGHNSGNDAVFLGRPSHLMIPSAYYDPFEVPELRTRLAQTCILTDDPESIDAESQFIMPSAGFDPFSSLPVELREMLLTHVATEDILSFRLSSRAMAAIPLSQYFFQSRFWPDREFEFYFDAFLLRPSDRAGLDWRALYRLSKARVRRNLVGLGEKNRLRIWNQTVRPLARAMGEITRLSELRGRPRDSEEAPGVLSKPLRTTQFHELEVRVFDARVELPASNIVAIHVSLFEFFGMKYVSGLAFETEHGQDVEIGYVIPGSEDPLIVEAGLEGFYIAADRCGVRAISPYTTRLHEYLDWVGDREGLHVQVLRSGLGMVRSIHATFDGFRMRALHIGNDNPLKLPDSSGVSHGNKVNNC